MSSASNVSRMLSDGSDRPGWWLLGALGATLAVWPAACVEQTDAVADSGPVLDAVGQNVVLPALDNYARSLDALQTEVERWNDTGEIAGARTAFAQAMDRWQVVDVLRVALDDGTDPLVLRDETYSWPVVNACRVDQVTASREYTDGVADLLVNGRGLDALEHLLYAGTDNVCPSQVAPNSDGTWDTLDDLNGDRAAYAAAIVDDLQAQEALFRSTWENARPASLQALIDGLFVFETEIKDAKVGHPLGIIDCDDFDCADSAEGNANSNSSAWIAANLEGFRALFTGGDGLGVDDLLTEIGSGDVAVDVVERTTTAIAMAEALDGSLSSEIVNNRQAVVELYDELNAIDDVTGMLSLQIPAVVGGDND
jgi:predicted lipoprotein